LKRQETPSVQIYIQYRWCFYGKKLFSELILKNRKGRHIEMEQTKENKMGTMPVNRLLITMSLPMVISMLVQALYNVVDSIFVARINENALTAVSLAFPIQSLMIAVAAGTCVGINAVLSRSLGEKDYDKVNKCACNGIILMALSFLFFVAVGIFGVSVFYKSQTSDAEILRFGTDYLTIVCCCSFGIFMQFTFERLLQATGKTFYTMITQGTGAIINIILDPILIFGLGGMPRMGVKGAAVATVIGQVIAGVLALYLNFMKNDEVKIRKEGLKLEREIVGQIYAVGIPSMIMQAIGSLMTYGMNLILISFSSTAAAVFGVYFKLQSFVFMPIFGMNNGLVPILAYNFGAGKKERFLKTVKLGIVYAFAAMMIGLLLFNIIPERLLLMFDASETMLGIGVPALRTISISYLFAGFCIICGTVFQALGRAVYSMIVSIARQLVVLLPAAYLLSLAGNVNYVWWAFPIAEIMSLLMTVFFMIRINRQIISHIGS